MREGAASEFSEETCKKVPEEVLEWINI